MGLFNFLKKDKQEYSKNLESIYEISKIEINDLIVDAKLLSEEKIDDNLVIQEYQKKLVRPLMNLFDSVNFKILKENSKIKYDDYQNVNIGIATFFNSEKSAFFLTLSQILSTFDLGAWITTLNWLLTSNSIFSSSSESSCATKCLLCFFCTTLVYLVAFFFSFVYSFSF